MFYIVLLAVLAILARVLSSQGLRPALAVGWGLTLVLPVWIYREFGPLKLDLPISIAIVLIAGTLLQASIRFPRRLVIADFLIIGLVAVITLSRFQADGWKLTSLVTTALEWGLPYLFGRVLFRSVHDIAQISKVAAWVCLTLSCWAIGESLLGVNPLDRLAIFAGRETSIGYPDAFRLGFKRQGSVSAPDLFWFGAHPVVPWALEVAEASRMGRGPKWCKFLPWINAAGVFFTLSRGPMLGLMIAASITAFIRWKPWRRRLLVAGLAVVVAMVAYRSLAMDALYAISGERASREIIFIGGQPHEYTGTSHRWLQFLVFQDAIDNAGLIGFGRMAPLETAPHFQYVEEHLRARFYSIDNHYLYMLLASGYLGISLFVLLGLCTLYYLAMQARQVWAPHSLFAAAAFGAMAASLITMATVWFAWDYGFYWMTLTGMAASWRAQAPAYVWAPQWVEYGRGAARGAVDRRLAPGHPVLD